MHSLHAQAGRRRSSSGSGHGKGRSALMSAARHSDPAMLAMLLRRGADPNAARAGDGATALMMAAQAGREPAVGLLLAAQVRHFPAQFPPF